MPNWCENGLVVTGPANQITEFVNAVRSDELNEYGKETYSIIESFLPRPEYAGPRQDSWYDWSLENWGSKWPDCDTLLTDLSATEVEFVFNTAWSPTLQATANISIMFPACTFLHYYNEPNMAFMGAAVFLDGEHIYQEDINGDDYVMFTNDGDIDPNFYKKFDDLIESVKKSADRIIITNKETHGT